MELFMEAEIVLDATLKKLKSRFNYPPPPLAGFYVFLFDNTDEKKYLTISMERSLN